MFAGVTRLRNGNTLVCNWNTRDRDDQTGAHIFEVTPDKRVVWHVTGDHIGQVAQCRILSDDLASPASHKMAVAAIQPATSR